jgi:hypothetical protein
MTEERRDPQPQQRQDNQQQQPIQDLEARPEGTDKADNVKGGRAVYTSDPQEGGQ